MTAFLVARLVDGLQHLLAELAGIRQDVVDQVGREILELRQVAVLFGFQEFVNEKTIIFDRGAINRLVLPSFPPTAFLRRTFQIQKRPDAEASGRHLPQRGRRGLPWRDSISRCRRQSR
jgi:hypothetical protein